MKTYVHVICIAILTPFVLVAQSDPSVSSLSFLTGTWKTQHEWGDMTEIWSTAEGDNLMCTFRCIQSGKVIFYEWIIIEASPSGTVMKLRHFHPGSIAWEEKEKPNTYTLVSRTDNQCVFESEDKTTRISYERLSTDKLVCYLEHADENGKQTKDAFHYTLQ